MDIDKAGLSQANRNLNISDLLLKKKSLKVKKMLLSSTMGNVGSMQRIFRAHPRDKKIWISLKFLTILCKNLSERDAFLGADLFYSTRIYKTLKTLSESPLILD